MPAKSTEKHLFTARRALIAIAITVLVALLIVVANGAMNWIFDVIDLVDTANS